MTRCVVALAALLALAAGVAAGGPPGWKLATWNVLFDDSRARERLPALIAAIAACDADVIATQESMPWFVDELLKDERFRAYHAAAVDGVRAETVAEGCSLVSRLPL